MGWLGKAAALGAALIVSLAAIPRAIEAPAAAPAAAQPQCEIAPAWPAIPPGAPPNSTYEAARKPIPDRFRQPMAGIKIDFMSADDVNRKCAGGILFCNRAFLACARGHHLNMPNPCDAPGALKGEGYAGLLCHELAHLNGWPRTHGD